MEAISAIIFDLGNVIMDIDSKREAEYFERLGVKSYSSIFNLTDMHEFFQRQEIGAVREDVFYDGFRQLTGIQLSDEQIKEGWNLILTKFQPERMSFLEELAHKYPIYLFSNTNDIHTREFEAMCLEQMGRPLTSYFEKVFYSQELGMRKPDPLAFEKVLNLSGLEAKSTLFVDDNTDNIKGAQSIGLQTIHLTAPRTLLDLNF